MSDMIVFKGNAQSQIKKNTFLKGIILKCVDKSELSVKLKKKKKVEMIRKKKFYNPLRIQGSPSLLGYDIETIRLETIHF